MIRLVQRRLIVPRGDTGTFSIPTLAGKDSGDAAIFTVFDPLMHRKIFEKEMSLSDGALGVDFTHNDTVNLPVGQYVWDIKFYTDPLIVDGKLVGGTEVDSYYSAFTLPICEIRETGDNLLMSDDAPTGALRPGQVDIITASIREITSLKESAAESAANADTSATNAESSASAAATSAQDALDSKVAALAAQQTASAASESAASAAANAQASATLAAQRADQVMVKLGTKANIEDLAAVAFSGLYSDLSGVPTIPQRVSDLQDDSGHYTKPVTGIPASDLEETYLTSFTETDPTVSAWAKEATKPSYTPQEVGALPADTFIPSKVSDLTDDSGHYTKPVGGIPASDLAETYLTQHQDISGKADKSEIPTQVSQLTNDAGYITGYTETDPTVPAWAKAAQKPTYTAAEVGAPTVQQMNDAIAAVNTMKIHICTQGEYNSETGVPIIQNPDTQTFYLVPGGDSNNLFIEWAYVNNAWERFGSADVDLSNYVQKTDYATNSTAGIVSIGSGVGLTISQTGILGVAPAGNNSIKSGMNSYNPIVPEKEHLATFYGLAKAAGDSTQSVSTNAVGTYTPEAKEAIQQMLDVPSKSEVQNLISISTTAPQGEDAKIWIDTDDSTTVQVPTVAEMNLALAEKADIEDIPEVPVQDVQVNGSSILSDGIANIPIAGPNTFGVIKVNGNGLNIINGMLYATNATSTEIKNGNSGLKAINAANQHLAVFYGLATAAGDTTQKVSTNAVGTYTNEAKAAIQTMLGITDALATKLNAAEAGLRVVRLI